jgi:N-acetylglucosamine-6-phosphate deacetylase
MIALTARALLTPLERIERPLVLIEDGQILSVTSQSHAEAPTGATQIDFREHTLAPGLVDIHVHGSAGYDVMQDDAQGLRRFEGFLASHGVASYYPTTVTAPLKSILTSLERLAYGIESVARSSEPRARPLGIHLEGPFLSHVRRGVHPPEELLRPDLGVFEKLWHASRGHIRVMTIAPELPGALELIREATGRGVCVSVGHSDATLDETSAAISAGARHATHTFNAMRPLEHRAPGILGAVLSDPSLTADIIADGIHVHPAMVRLFLNAKGADHAVLITDATAATGMPDGRYQLGGFEVDVRDGKCLHDGKLAGSVLTLDNAVKNVMRFAQWGLPEALRLATVNPARIMGAKRKGEIAAGKDADLVVLSDAGHVQASMVNGVLLQP